MNFLDVLDVLGTLPFERNSLGGECAGEVAPSIGDEVTDYRCGDRVLVMAEGSFQQYVTVPTDKTVLIPENLSFAAAASIPVNFLTAYYALHVVAQIQPGDRVLIHAAGGGTGNGGCADCTGDWRRGLWDSESSQVGSTTGDGSQASLQFSTLDFAAEILRDTDGRGVAIVLNSLTGDGFIEKSLSTLLR